MVVVILIIVQNNIILMILLNNIMLMILFSIRKLHIFLEYIKL